MAHEGQRQRGEHPLGLDCLLEECCVARDPPHPTDEFNSFMEYVVPLGESNNCRLNDLMPLEASCIF